MNIEELHPLNNDTPSSLQPLYNDTSTMVGVSLYKIATEIEKYN